MKNLKKFKQFVNEKLDPVGEEDMDINNDGEIDREDSYLTNRRWAISRKMKKNKKKSSSEEEEVSLSQDKKEKFLDKDLKVKKKLQKRK